MFLDISVPPSKDKKLLSGEDVGLMINRVFPSSKIIVSTTFNDNYRIQSILKNMNPDGFLIKLYSLCVDEFDDVRLTCKWYDETETQCGVAYNHPSRMPCTLQCL